MDTPTSLDELWLNAWLASAMDCEVTVNGNGHYAGAVISTLQVVAEALGMDLQEPSREEMISYLKDNDREDEIEYLMEE